MQIGTYPGLKCTYPTGNHYRLMYDFHFRNLSHNHFNFQKEHIQLWYPGLHLELLMCSCKFDLGIKPMFTLMHEVSLVGELTFILLFSLKKKIYKDLKRFLRRLFADGKFLDEKFASQHVAHVSISVAMLKPQVYINADKHIYME